MVDLDMQKLSRIVITLDLENAAFADALANLEGARVLTKIADAWKYAQPMETLTDYNGNTIGRVEYVPSVISAEPS